MTGMTLTAQLTLAAAQHPRPDFERAQWQSLDGVTSGIAVYGSQMGCYPMDPTVILEF